MSEDAQQRDEMLKAALGHLRAALDLLDRADAPAQIGAHVDLAVCQLSESTTAPSVSIPRPDVARY